MRFEKIYSYQIGLVYKGESFTKVLREGKYFLMPSEKLKVYKMTEEFKPDTDLEILLKNGDLASKLDVYTIADNEIAIYYEGKNFKKVLLPGIYAYWKNVKEYRVQVFDTNELDAAENLERRVLDYLVSMNYVRKYQLEKFNKGLLFLDGEYIKTLKAGVYYFWNYTKSVNVRIIDTRVMQMEFSGQELLTKDKANIRINFISRFQIIDIEKALLDNNDYEKQLYVILQLALREFIGTKTLDVILENKITIENDILETIRDRSKDLGIEIVSCGIKDIILPGDVKEILNKVLIAEKKAQANIIKRREETASTRSLLNTAKLMEDNKMLFKLKQMEYIETISEKIGEITLGNSSLVTEQLRQIFSPND